MGRLSMVGPRVKAADVTIAKLPPKQVDPYYRSDEWRELRGERLRIDDYVCAVPGCGERAIIVDHVIARKDGGPDAIDNLRSLCRAHDNRVKEDTTGARRRGGRLED
jgi:5-methylcytosine-specific restriction endonuclease McrA